jgi:hypothetical protein
VQKYSIDIFLEGKYILHRYVFGCDFGCDFGDIFGGSFGFRNSRLE